MARKDIKETVEYNNNFNKEHYDRVTILLPKGKKEKLKSYAGRQGKSVNAFIISALDKYIKESGLEAAGENIQDTIKE